MSHNAFTDALESNKGFAERFRTESPDLLKQLSTGQKPKILWLGCSDSRVPETTVLGLKPGDVFVHRNIANVLHAGDISSLAVIEFAVKHLCVEHVVLCGHIGCGGVNAALGQGSVGSVLDNWLMPIRRLRVTYKKELEALQGAERAKFLVAANVKEGIQNLKGMSVIADAIDTRGLQVHGVVYDVGTALVETVDGCEVCEEDRPDRESVFKVK